MNIRVLPTAGLSDSDRIALRRLFDAAYDGDFTDDDFDHALGGWHAIAGDLAAPIAHAAVVARSLLIDTRELRTGFVEAGEHLESRGGATRAPCRGPSHCQEMRAGGS